MQTLQFYLDQGTDADAIAASAMTADSTDHAMTGACLMLDELAAKSGASGHVIEATVLRRAMRWLQAETEAHRKVADKLKSRAGADVIGPVLKARRQRLTASREAMRPLMEKAGQYLRLALKRAAIDEAQAMLDTGTPEGVAVAQHIVDFLKASEPEGADHG